MNEIIKIHNDEPRAGTFLISKGFGRTHKKILELCREYISEFMELENNKALPKCFIISKLPTKKAGRPIEEYLLNEGQTILLGSLLRAKRGNDQVLRFKVRLAKAFVKIKKQLVTIKDQQGNADWVFSRDFGKEARLEETDVVKEFIVYAKAQGGSEKSCDKYYSNITKMMNGLLFIVTGKFKVLRDVLTPRQLMIVSAAEGIITKTLRDDMKINIHYKTIYQRARSNVEIFAELHGQSEVITKQIL